MGKKKGAGIHCVFRSILLGLKNAAFCSSPYLEGKVLIEKLSSPEVLSSINALLKSKPELLEEWETMALSDILGRSLVKDGKYVPIESGGFKNALTLSR